MKKKLVVLGIVGTVVLGGAVGVGAFAKEAEVPSKKAEQIAMQEVKGALVKEIELERENGELIYEVELEGTHDDDVEVDVNATTGKVVRVDDDRDDDDAKANNVATETVVKVNEDRDDDDDRVTSQKAVSSPKVSKEQAISIATKDTPGKIVEIELDDDNHYEIEMIYEGKEVEMEISAVDGTVLKKEIDDLDDNDNDNDDDDDKN
ncbi:PepSY domain-containing protein [Fredinandcohnia onubensis]|uniref:PepSY domain-containing protein n=1 Tax=Fredinandcohnia onubensis TaxID=1571209 RepID=UPI0015D4A3FE|nr:PepSY domain-containing protein [Fredinandcohnia onubensis]